ncbi:MAG TPA: amidohydrolase family protein [Alphaproteobacteria bacterium]|nr:amidohydrolase family protein [Alphaproteobacteria bacterium]
MSIEQLVGDSAQAALPRGSWDCQIHVYGDMAKYPVRNDNTTYKTPMAASPADAAEMHDRIGIEGVVIVQPTLYATDHSLLIDTLRARPASRARGVVILDDEIDDAQLERLHAAGVRGARFNFQKRFGLVPEMASFHRAAARIREFGWFIKIHVGPAELAAIESDLRRVPLPVVIDHMAQLKTESGIDRDGFKRAIDIIRQENRWMMLSNGDRNSLSGYPWDDIVAVGRAFYEAAPERCIWGSDWPHLGARRHGPVPEAADLIALLRRYLPDEHALRQVLVDNPNRLLGF